MSRSFCREYEEFKTQRNAKRQQEWLEAKEPVWQRKDWSEKQERNADRRSRDDKRQLVIPSATGNSAGLKRRHASAGQARHSSADQGGIDSFDSPPSSEEDNSPVVCYGKEYIDVDDDGYDDNNGVGNTGLPPPRKKRLSDQFGSNKSHLKVPSSRSHRNSADSRYVDTTPGRSRRRKKVPSSSNFGRISPLDDDISWSDSEHSQDIRDRQAGYQTDVTTPVDTSGKHQPHGGSSRSATSDIDSSCFLSSWREAFQTPSSASAPLRSEELDVVRSDDDTSSLEPMVSGIHDFESDPESEPSSKDTRPSLSTRTVPDSEGEDEPRAEESKQKGSNWLSSLRQSSHDMGRESSLMNDTMTAALATEVRGPTGTAQMWRSGKWQSPYVKGGYAERVHNLLAKHQSNVTFLQHQIRSGLVTKSNSCVVQVMLTSNAVSGAVWLYCGLVEGVINATSGSPAVSSAAVSSAAEATHNAPSKPPALSSEVVIVVLPDAVCKRLSMAVGMQVRLFPPWQVCRLKNFCVPFLLLDVCEAVRQPSELPSTSHDLAQSALYASLGICPYHISSASCDSDAVLCKSVYTLSTDEQAITTSTSSSRSTRVALADGDWHGDNQLKDKRNQTTYHLSIVNAIEGAGGCGSAINGGVAVAGRVQLAHMTLGHHACGNSNASGRSLVAARRSQFLKPASERFQQTARWLLVVQDSSGTCFQVQVDKDDMPLTFSEPSQLLGRVIRFHGLRLTDRLTVKRSPSLLSLLKCFTSAILPSCGTSQADSEPGWEREQSHSITSTFYCFQLLPRHSEQVTLALAKDDSVCSWVKLYPTCSPNPEWSVVRNKYRLTRWTTVGRLMHSYMDGSTQLLVVAILASAVERPTLPHTLWPLCSAASDAGGCKGCQKTCYSEQVELKPLCISVQPSCIVPSALAPSSKVVLHLENILLSEQAVPSPDGDAASSGCFAVADMYSSLTIVWPMARDDGRSCPAELVPLLGALSNVSCTYPVTGALQPMTFAVLSGEVIGVDESTAFSWSVCERCGADVEVTADGMPSCLYCRQCGTVLDEVSTVSHLQLDVYLELDEVPGSSTSSSFHVRLQQKSISEILPTLSDSQNPDVGYDFSLVIGKPLANLTCLVTSVSFEESGTQVIQAAEMPSLIK